MTEAKQASDNKLSWQQQKEEQARQRKRENELKKVEARIEELETRDKEIDETMILPDICTKMCIRDRCIILTYVSQRCGKPVKDSIQPQQ